jgi:tetratricopeptide (TPR) repeat protein
MGVIIEEIVDEKEIEDSSTVQNHTGEKSSQSRVTSAYIEGDTSLEEHVEIPEVSPEEEDLKNPDIRHGCSSDEDSDSEEDLTEEEKRRRCDQAEEYKKQGNEFYSSGMYEDAIDMYTKALETAPLVGKRRRKKGGEMERQRCIYFANRAACYISRENYEEAIEDCGNAIDLDESYLKAYMRRATAFEHVEEYDRGLTDVTYILENIDPRNAFALSYKARITPIAEKRREELKDEMMGKLKDLGNSILGNFGLSLDNFKAEQDPNTGSYSIKFSQE